MSAPPYVWEMFVVVLALALAVGAMAWRSWWVARRLYREREKLRRAAREAEKQ